VIVGMKKVSVLCLASAREGSLEAMREMGVLHVISGKAPESDELKRAEENLGNAQRVLEVLGRQKQSKKQMMAAFAKILQPGVEMVSSVDDLLERVTGQINRNHELDVRIEALTHEIGQIEPLGRFDPESVRRLGERGVTIQLYYAAASERLTAPETAVKIEIQKTRRGEYFALAAFGPIAWDKAPLPMPKRSIDAAAAELSKSLAEREEGERRLQMLSVYHDVVVRHVLRLEDSVRFIETKSVMPVAGKVSYLRGFCPEDRVEALRKESVARGWGLLVEDPAEGEPVPTLVRNPKWCRSIKTAFDVLGLMPGYKEVDISAVFLLFFSLFFAMLVGDACYGLIFLGLTLAARRAYDDAPAAPFTLLKILSVCTIVWGVATGTYFGMSDPPAFLLAFKIDWLAQESNLMNLCFLLGAVQLTIAHVWNITRYWWSLKVLDEAGRILITWTMFFAARTMILGAVFPTWMFYFFGAGVLALILFMTPVKQLKTEWYNHVMLPLNIISMFVDVVSYVRLFAVGFAGFAIANNFNEMALGAGAPGPLAGLGSALILFLGHSLNIVLSCMGVLVHGIRLNALEFSGHLGMQWSGYAYNPFARMDSQPRKGD